MDEKKPIEIVFAPGCFDDFEGTQEELDQMIKEITDIFSSGDLNDARITPLEPSSEEEMQEFLEEVEKREETRVRH